MSFELVTLRTYSHDYEAELDRSLLSEQGIDTFIADQNISNMHFGYAIATGGIRLQVKQEDVEQAVDVLGLLKDNSQHHTQTVQCPICKSDNTKHLSILHPLNWRNLLILFWGALTVTPAKTKHVYWICKNCNQQFKDNQ